MNGISTHESRDYYTGELICQWKEDHRGRIIYERYANGDWWERRFDESGNVKWYRDSDGYERGSRY